MAVNSISKNKSPSSVASTQEHKDGIHLCEMMAGSDVGIAVYDSHFKLISYNAAYAQLRNLTPQELVQGTSFSHVVRQSLMADSHDEENAKKIFEIDLKRLQTAGKDSVEGAHVSGQRIRFQRFTLDTGGLIENITLLDNQDDNNWVERDTHPQFMVGHNRLTQALNSMSDGVAIFDTDDFLVAVNNRYLELSHHISDALKIGTHYDDIVRAIYRSGAIDIKQSDEEAFIAFSRQERLAKSSKIIDKMKDGRWLRFAGNRLEDGSTIFTQTDITDLRKEQILNEKIGSQLNRSSLQLRAALENMFAGFIMFDEENRLIMFNNQYVEMFKFQKGFVKPGIKRQELMKQAIQNEAFLGGYLEDAREIVKAHDTHSQPSLNKYHLSDGRIVQVRYTPVAGLGSVVLLMDITSEEMAKKEIQQSNIKLERSNEELQSFAYVASHDLQEPLRKIEAFSSRLVSKYNDQFDERGQHYLERIDNAANRMRQLINDLLSFSRVTSKANAFAPIELKKIVQDVASDMDITIQEKQANIIINDLPAIDADPLQMRQLFQNLMSNSLKFAKEDETPVITISSTLLDAPMPADRAVRIELQDNGIGFDNRYKNQIFAIFQRLHGRMDYEGTGIGLATCRKIVERHQGTIDADGVEGKGAKFIVTIPLQQQKTEEK